MPIPSEKLEKFVAWPGIEPGSPANMASALTTELPKKVLIKNIFFSQKFFLLKIFGERKFLINKIFGQKFSIFYAAMYIK